MLCTVELVSKVAIDASYVYRAGGYDKYEISK